MSGLFPAIRRISPLNSDLYDTVHERSRAASPLQAGRRTSAYRSRLCRAEVSPGARPRHCEETPPVSHGLHAVFKSQWHQLSQCCPPLPPERFEATLTRSRSVSIWAKTGENFTISRIISVRTSVMFMVPAIEAVAAELAFLGIGDHFLGVLQRKLSDGFARQHARHLPHLVLAVKAANSGGDPVSDFPFWMKKWLSDMEAI